MVLAMFFFTTYVTASVFFVEEQNLVNKILFM